MYPRTAADTCIPYVSRMYPTCISYPTCVPPAGVPTLQELQGRAKEMKRARTAAVQLDQLIDLKNLALTYFQPMPEPLTLMPALRREPQVEPDSSDEEAERLQLLGQQGK